jgi:hypothetical protein
MKTKLKALESKLSLNKQTLTHLQAQYVKGGEDSVKIRSCTTGCCRADTAGGIYTTR